MGSVEAALIAPEDAALAEGTRSLLRAASLLAYLPQASAFLLDLLPRYAARGALHALGQGLVAPLEAPGLSAAAGQVWRDLWRGPARMHGALRLPFRLLDAAVRHRQSQDPRALLALPLEERRLLASSLEPAE